MTHKIKKQPILVPVDFSPCSEEALLYAANLAASLRFPLTVLHVVHDPGQAPGYYAMKGRKKQLRRMEDVAADMMEEFMVAMKKKHPDMPVLVKATNVPEIDERHGHDVLAIYVGHLAIVDDTRAILG